MGCSELGTAEHTPRRATIIFLVLLQLKKLHLDMLLLGGKAHISKNVREQGL